MKSKAIILALILGLGLISITGCKKDSGFGGIKCYNPSTGIAVYGIGDNWGSTGCNTAAGAYKVSTIPTAGLIGNGGCHGGSGTEDEGVIYFYSGNSTCSDLSNCQSYCSTTLGGYWDTSTKFVSPAKELKF